MESSIRVFETVEEVARTAAEQFVEVATTAVAKRGRFAAALAGGSTPRRMFELLGGDQLRKRVDWPAVHLFFSDERCVPREHADSNYRMAYESLISRVDIPEANIHPINGEGEPERNAALYETELREFFSGGSTCAFDLVLLGLGDDGHTASLFPGTGALAVTDKWVVANWVEKLASYRITLTPAAINGAAQVTFLVTGANKASAVKAVLEGPLQPENLPAQLIKPEAGTITWLLDSQAASRLSKH
jgi:6-phosphogluconolactonase